MKKAILATATALALSISAGAWSAANQTTSAPQGVTQTVNLTATVEKIDHKTREVTLKGPEGKTISMTVGPEARNFDQVKVGDKIKVRYSQALLMGLRPKGEGTVEERSETAALERAAPGEKPSGVAHRMVEVSATVKSINPKNREVTLKGPEKTLTVVAPEDLDLRKIKEGDQVVATYAEALAVSVEPGGKTKEHGRKY